MGMQVFRQQTAIVADGDQLFVVIACFFVAADRRQGVEIPESDHQKCRFGHAEVVRLLTAFFNVRFFELRDKYDDFATLAPRGDDKFEVVMSSDSDLPTTVLRLQIADQSKTIVLRDNYPAELRELTKSIDAEAGSAAWIVGAAK